MIDEQGALKRIDYGGVIHFNSDNGIAGTTYPIGTAGMPSDVIANAIAICVARNINKIHVIGTLAIGAGVAQDLVGHYSILTAQTAGNAYVRDFKGYLEIDAMVGGTLDIYANGADIQINADCTAGTINIYGNARVVNNTGGAVVNNYTVEYKQDMMQPGVENFETIDDELDAMLDLGGGDVETLLMDGTEQPLYETTGSAFIYAFLGLWIDWTGEALDR